MTNPIKNEVLFEVGTLKYKLRPTFECLIEIEDQLLREGRYKTLIEFVEAVGGKKASLKETVIVLKEASRAGGKAISDDELEKAVSDYGVVPIQMALADFLGKALYGGPQLQAQIEEDAKKK